MLFRLQDERGLTRVCQTVADARLWFEELLSCGGLGVAVYPCFAKGKSFYQKQSDL